MASGSKRKAPSGALSSSRKKGKAVSNDFQQHATPTTSLATSSSNVSVDRSSTNVVVPLSPQAPMISSGSSGGFFTNASHFSVINPIMVDNSTSTTVNIYGANDRRKAMKRLSEHIIHGAAHDSSARDPPPRCHPGTRIKINEHIITWFYDEDKKELLIWVYGPAGVGKSAIMQTLAEKLSESKHLGASAFVSRPNGRNSSRQLFLTIAYQLAVHIEDYCTFITEKLSRDPELVNKGMEEQFRTLIVEPFVDKIGASGHPWGILLDGLDELDEHQSQRTVIRLIADFVLKHPDVPLRWLITSRPEAHICGTFDEETVVPAYQKQYVPANSEESCRDVERFLRAGLERIRKEFPRTVPKDWPREQQLSSLAAAASGLFVLADTAIRFIEDPRYANPTVRLGRVLSALSGPQATDSHDQLLAPLDALYTSILDSIPSDVWLTTKRVLGALLYARVDGWRFVLKRLGAISVLLSLDLSTVYASVNGCSSLVNTSDPEDAGFQPATFYHASFSDYLLDLTRSKEYYISIEDAEDDLLQSSLKIWQDFRTTCPPVPGLTYENRWIKYFSTFVSFEHKNYSTFSYDLMWYIHEALFTILVEKHNLKKTQPFSSNGDKDQCFDLLTQLEDATICEGFQQIDKLTKFLFWVFDLWKDYQEELVFRGVIQEVGLKQVQLSQLGTCSAKIQIVQDESILKEYTYNAGDFGNLLAAISPLESHLLPFPVLACGSPGKCCLVLKHQVNASDLTYQGLEVSLLEGQGSYWICFAIPFPHSNFYHDAEQFLTSSFQALQRKYSQTVPKTWPSKEKLLKLAGAVSHHSMLATIAIQFIEDPCYNNPIAHLDQVIALIDGVDSFDDQPFIYVDALYTYVLNSISSDIWPTTQQVLGAFLYGTIQESHSIFTFAKGISVVFGFELKAVYTALSGCSLMVQLPLESIVFGSMAFHHTSFCEFLMDPARSKEFHISMEDTKGHILKLLVNIWEDFKKFSYRELELDYYSTWDKYCSQYHSHDPSSDCLVANFNWTLFHDVHDAPFLSISQHDLNRYISKQSQENIFHVLSQLDFNTLSRGFTWTYRADFIIWIFKLLNKYKKALRSRDLFQMIQFKDLQFDFGHLEVHLVCSHVLHCTAGEDQWAFEGNTPTSTEELQEYISGLQHFQKQQPQLQVLIGGSSGRKFMLFEYEYSEDDLREQQHYPKTGKQTAGDLGYYILPCPDNAPSHSL